MTLPIEVVELEPANAVVLPETEPGKNLSEAIPKAITRVTSFLAAARVAPSGPAFVRYLRWDAARRIEIGFPLTNPEAVPGLRSTLLPGGRAAKLVHVGPYEGLPGAFEQVRQWVLEHAEHRSPPWESYWTVHGGDLPRTDIVWPIGPV